MLDSPNLSTDHIRAALYRAGAPHRANDNIADHLSPGDLDAIRLEVQHHVQAILDALIIDRNDPNTLATAERVSTMFCHEVFAGRFTPQPKLTSFPNERHLDEILTVGPIPVRSACSHHLVPITGSAWVAAIPGDTIIGLSKFNRVVEWIMSRPQIQEEATVQIADALDAAMPGNQAIAVIVRASHLCCAWRGVRHDGSLMTTSVMRGLAKTDDKCRREILALIAGMGY